MYKNKFHKEDLAVQTLPIQPLYGDDKVYSYALGLSDSHTNALKVALYFTLLASELNNWPER